METITQIKDFVDIEKESVDKLFSLLNKVRGKHFLDKRIYKTIELVGKDTTIKSIYVVKDHIKMDWEIIHDSLAISIYGSVINMYNNTEYEFKITKMTLKSLAYHDDHDIISLYKNGIEIEEIDTDECKLLKSIIVFVTSVLINAINWEDKLNTTYSESFFNIIDMLNTFIRPMLNKDYLNRFENYLLNTSDKNINLMMTENRTYFSYHRLIKDKFYLRMSVDITGKDNIRVGFERFDNIEELKGQMYRSYPAIEFDLYDNTKNIIMELRNGLIDILDVEYIEEDKDYRNYIAIMIRDFGMLNKNDL